MSDTATAKPLTASIEPSFLVGDVGGTNCRLAVARVIDGELKPTQLRRYKCADFARAEDAIDAYLSALDWSAPLSAAVIAVAGPVVGGEVRSTNMHWRMSEAMLTGHGAQRVKLINDYTALALSIEHLAATDLAAVGPDIPGDPQATAAVIGAGTGFGCGALARGVGGSVAIATEGGHIAFSPGDPLEIEILRILTNEFGRVSVERLLSGPGLVNLHRALAKIAGAGAEPLSSEEIVSAANGGPGLCRDAVERFCEIYGHVAGDVALIYGARAGVFLGGGIAPELKDYFQQGGFRRRFEANGRVAA
jgi:glucokinase